jgi:hypothetical protein
MILGGLIGFLIGVSFGVAQGSAWPAVIWRASIATFLAGVLMRWWGRMWIRSLQAAQRERLLPNPQEERSTARGASRP